MKTRQNAHRRIELRTQSGTKPGVKTAAFSRRIGIKGWRKSNYFTDTWRYPLLRRWLSARLPVRKGLVLSVGCGTGELERELSEEGGHRVIGLDLSFEMLRAARRLGS